MRGDRNNDSEGEMEKREGGAIMSRIENGRVIIKSENAVMREGRMILKGRR